MTSTDTDQGAPAATTEDLLYEVKDGIAKVTFNRPQARNAMTFAMYERLKAICADANDDHTIKAIVITGAGEDAFAAGTDISQFRAFKTADDALAYESRINGVLAELEGCRVPTIAAISGACTGGGAGIASSCDLRIAARNARFGFPIARTLGNCLSMANYARLYSLIGPARTKEIIFTARLVGAEEARSIGLVSEVLDDHAALMARAQELAETVARHAPLTLQATKQALLRLRSQMAAVEGHDLIVMCYTSEDFREGMDAFLNKRKPAWKGR
ncbi:enoyl-CoA hydratase/isomerase family protein [Propylenella binzhouense]|uniref:Enoyl-CoA hydratase n=1 Tax=Propylenella binzhouense TaxID=2555902 RepID=A0A964T7I7_9HYPH|nr:enoyl-CoA hydratase/isomerase family protein [Propylenella binzhouense]MYZ49948.1 enoyl-CoA hydratase [Propylenella binzhouense]